MIQLGSLACFTIGVCLLGGSCCMCRLLAPETACISSILRYCMEVHSNAL